MADPGVRCSGRASTLNFRSISGTPSTISWKSHLSPLRCAHSKEVRDATGQPDGRGVRRKWVFERHAARRRRRDDRARDAVSPRGREAVSDRHQRVHDRDRQPVLADEARKSVGLPRDGRRRRGLPRRRHRSRQDEGDRERRRSADRPRPGDRRRPDHGGHVRLVRPGLRRQPVVPRRGHDGIREREAEDYDGLLGGRRRRSAAGDHHAREPAGGDGLSRGVLQGPRGGRRLHHQHRRARQGPARPVRARRPPGTSAPSSPT
jgi:hypothetical protein